MELSSAADSLLRIVTEHDLGHAAGAEYAVVESKAVGEVLASAGVFCVAKRLAGCRKGGKVALRKIERHAPIDRAAFRRLVPAAFDGGIAACRHGQAPEGGAHSARAVNTCVLSARSLLRWIMVMLRAPRCTN